MDTVAVEIGIYSAATLQNIYGGKACKRGVEYHIMMSVAIVIMKFDVILGELPTGPVSMQCVELKKALHDRSPDNGEGLPRQRATIWSTLRSLRRMRHKHEQYRLL